MDWRDFFYIIRDSDGMENTTVVHDCMDTRWIYDIPEQDGVVKETRQAKYTKTTTITTHPAFGIPANETWKSNVTYRDVKGELGHIQSPLLRAGSMSKLISFAHKSTRTIENRNCKLGLYN